ncbi:MAG: DUF6456 domain-containing protein [Pseudomonadota bacterium]
MGDGNKALEVRQDVCSWVPAAALRYVAHTEQGVSIRGLARDAGCHASTVLRQVRSFEARRDDPLIDEALRRIGVWLEHHSPDKSAQRDSDQSASKEDEMTELEVMPVDTDGATLSDARLREEARRILQRLSEPGAVLAVAAEMDKAVVVRETEASSTRTAVVDRHVAEAMALKNWISCAAPARISRYKITGAGRITLEQLRAEADLKKPAFVQSDAAFLGAEAEDDAPVRQVRKRYGTVETPLVLLARRRDGDGARFLSEEMVRAGERLREDFEMAQVELHPDAEWESVLDAFDPQGSEDLARATKSARGSVRRALEDLGPGLSDVTLRCCCFLEGLESAEKKMGWSARSGKIVLRIALQRLQRHYDALGDEASMMG